MASGAIADVTDIVFDDGSAPVGMTVVGAAVASTIVVHATVVAVAAGAAMLTVHHRGSCAGANTLFVACIVGVIGGHGCCWHRCR